MLAWNWLTFLVNEKAHLICISFSFEQFPCFCEMFSTPVGNSSWQSTWTVIFFALWSGKSHSMINLTTRATFFFKKIWCWLKILLLNDWIWASGNVFWKQSGAFCHRYQRKFPKVPQAKSFKYPVQTLVMSWWSDKGHQHAMELAPCICCSMKRYYDSLILLGTFNASALEFNQGYTNSPPLSVLSLLWVRLFACKR